jgi:uncharacterized protein YciI
MRCMPDYFLVDLCRGAQWTDGLSRRQQTGWDAHGAFMDRLVEEGFVVAGGPVGELDEDEAVLAVRAEDEEEVRARLEKDPWHEQEVLSIRTVRMWTIWLGSLGRSG